MSKRKALPNYFPQRFSFILYFLLHQVHCLTKISNGTRQGKPEKFAGKATDIAQHNNENGEPDKAPQPVFWCWGSWFHEWLILRKNIIQLNNRNNFLWILLWLCMLSFVRCRSCYLSPNVVSYKAIASCTICNALALSPNASTFTVLFSSVLYSSKKWRISSKKCLGNSSRLL